MAKIRKKYITENVDFWYYNIKNNIYNLYSHKLINDGDASNDVFKSGVLSSNKVKKIINENSEMGTLPSTIITTGKELQDFNDPFDDTNILEFSTNSKSTININSNIGFPLVNLTNSTGANVGFYITTNPDLISKDTISESDSDYKSKYALKNTLIFDTPNVFNNDLVNKRGISGSLAADHPLYERHVGKVTNDVDEHILKQTRFQALYTPFSENCANFEIPSAGDDDYSFYNSTIDNDIKENYSLGSQKQIKILLDFNSAADLMLLNTKLTFNYESPTTNKSGFTDNLIATRYVNFLNGDNVGDSYSSHFMPTAYWNFNNSRWNYLDGAILESDDYSLLDVNDFPVETTDEIKYSYLGAKNTKGLSLSISPNLIFDTTASTNIVSSDIQQKHIKNSILSVYNKPLLTTPSFRNDGSLNLANSSAGFNKTSISNITSSYGFPYKANWQPNKDHLLDMSKYIKNDFLLEKVVIKGTFTSRGEMPVKKGNYSSGYSESGNALSSLNDFNSSYSMKDDHNNYVSNALTFFILNERKGLNYIDQKLFPDLQQSYFYSKELTSILDDSNNTQGEKLKNFLGDFKSYEQYQDTLNVYSQIIPSNYVYGLDDYNNLSLKDTYTFNSNAKKCSLALHKSVFHYLDLPSDSGSGDIVDSIYFIETNNSDSLYQSNLLSGNANYNIKIEENNNNSYTDFDLSTSRELVSYSNMLIINKHSNIELDSEVIKNIDKSHVINTDDTSDDLHLNIKDKTKFEVKSFVKSISTSNYIDESVYKIKSNYKESLTTAAETVSSIHLGNSDFLYLDNSGVYPIVSLFDFDDESAANETSLTKIFNQSITPLISSGDIPNGKIPFSISYHEFSLNIDVGIDGNKVPVKYLIKFSYKNPNNSGNSGVPYSNRNNYSGETKLYLFDFIEHSEETHGGDVYNVVDLNLRFLDPWDDYGILGAWVEFDRLGINSQLSEYHFGPPASDSSVTISSNDTWPKSGAPTDQMFVGLIKFIMFGIYSKEIVTASNVSTSNKLHQYLSSEKIITIENNHPHSAKLYFLESIVDPYPNNQLSESINLSMSNIHGVASNSFFDIMQKRGGARGNVKVTNDELFYNYNNVLEGKTTTGPGNIGIESERVIDRKLLSNNTKLKEAATSISGKTFLSKNSYDNSNNISYLLKPEDRLVFGVTSNSNGEVMPTVVSLHDKVEITLIGRDYYDSSKQKTNESKSIRKTVIGDNSLNRSGVSIYQTSGSYFDNVWSKDNLLNSLEDFRNQKVVIGQKSSRKFGTYTGIKTFDQAFDSDKNLLYKTDSVNPSIASVFLDCLNKKPLLTIDSQDRYNYRNKTVDTLPSYKILLTDKISKTRLENFPKRYEKVISNWHNTFHLADQTYSSYFNNTRNKKIHDFSYNNLVSSTNNEDANYFIYYDTNSYSAGLNYENHTSQSVKSKFNNDYTNSGDNDSLYRYYKTLKTFMLPYSTSEIYQNALQIENNSVLKSNRFIFNNKLIGKNLTKRNIYQNNSYSVQYLLHDIHPEYFDITSDVATDLFGDPDTNYNISNWCIVIQLDAATGVTLIKELDSFNNNTYSSNFVINSDTKHYNHHIYLDVSKVPASKNIPTDINELYTVTKKFKLLTDTSGDDDIHYLVSPLYFWETNEINPLTGQALSNYNVSRFGRKTSLYNTANNKSDAASLNSSWYGSLVDGTHILANNNIYDKFLNEEIGAHDDATVPPASTLKRNIDITGKVNADAKQDLPYTINYLQQNSLSLLLNDSYDSGFLFSLTSHKLLNNQATENNPVYKFNADKLESLDNNNYLLQKNAYHFISEKYLDNNLSKVTLKKESLLSKDDINKDLLINEKIYLSNCKTVLSNGVIEDTSIDFVYKIHDAYIEKTLSSDENYNIIELKALRNNFTLLKKDKILEDTLIYNIDNTSKIRVYEEKILENASQYSESASYSIPYFEIDLSSNLSNDSSVSNGDKIKQIPYSHYSLDYVYDSTDPTDTVIGDFISPANDNDNLNTGSPIYKLAETPIGYSSKKMQESKTKDFFYGFSRGKSRYPIDRLDGFKYGVESGSKKSLNYHYSNRSYGNASDKIMGSNNYASMYLNNNGVTIFTWPVEKQFVNESFQYIASNNLQNDELYNKDKYSRSTHPYIEDTTNNLSQYYIPPVAT